MKRREKLDYINRDTKPVYKINHKEYNIFILDIEILKLATELGIIVRRDKSCYVTNKKHFEKVLELHNILHRNEYVITFGYTRNNKYELSLVKTLDL
jgi:hypothetical protein